MIITKKIRLKPTVNQNQQLFRSANIARWAYNYTLSMQQLNYRFGGNFMNDSEIRKHITKMKKRPKYAWLNNVSNNVVKQSVKDACLAYRRFFRGQSSFPKYKSKRRTTPSFYNDNVKLKAKKKLVLLEKIGWVETSEQLPVDCRYYNPRIKFDGKYWYLTVGIDQELEEVTLNERAIGIDIGVKELAVTSDNVIYKNINKTKTVKNETRRLKRLQRQASRKYKKGKPKSSNLIKLEKKIRHKHRRLQNIRDNYIHQITAEIVKTKPSRIVMEDLNIKGMMKNRHLSKAIAEQKLYFFKNCIKYKSEKYGIAFIEADRWFPSSKTCNNCGLINKNLKLSDRTYHCDCGYVCDRDLNASYNLRDYQAI